MIKNSWFFIYLKYKDYLKGKNVLITGGSRGLGLLLTKEFLKRGSSVVICARDHEELERARLIVSPEHRERLMAFPCDVTQKDELLHMLKTVRERMGGIDVLVNNAGIIQVGPMEEMTLEDYREAM